MPASGAGAELRGGAPRTWPERPAPHPAERIELTCAACGAPWWIHCELAGYRLRCACAAWIRVPPDPRAPASLRRSRPQPRLLPRPSPRGGPPALPRSAARARARAIAPDPPLAMRPPPRRRKGLQLAALLAALALPALVAELSASGAERSLLQPLVTLAAGLAVLASGLASRRGVLASLRPAAPRHFAEALFAAFAGAGLALAWSAGLAAAGGGELFRHALLREELGYGLALLLGAACPAVFEELAFRGLLQGRAATLLGHRAAIALAALAFALVQGLGPGLPAYLLLGLHLGSLRARSGSLLPGILEHFFFSALLVLIL